MMTIAFGALCLFVGAAFGILAAALCCMARRSDE